MALAWLTEWEESGWGIREDGFSLHRDEAEFKRFVKAYWDTMPDEVPEEYSRPCSEGQAVEVSDAVAHWLAKNGSLRLWEKAVAIEKEAGRPPKVSVVREHAAKVCSQIEEAWIDAGLKDSGPSGAPRL